MIAPCKECARRKPNCHSECPEYKAFENECAKRRQRRAEEAEKNDYVILAAIKRKRGKR